jgi:hypothetical protein
VSGLRKGESVKILMIRILMMSSIAFCVCVSLPYAQSQSNARPAMASEADFRRAMKELSNWGRWGADGELGAANLITPAKRRQALALAKEGVPVSLAHDIVQEKAADAPNILERVLGPVNPTGTADQYQYTGLDFRCGRLALGCGQCGMAHQNRVATVLPTIDSKV